MNISIIGLGYVGCTMTACLSGKNKVIGVDIDDNKVELLSKGKPTIFEPIVDELIKKASNKGNIVATKDLKYAVLNSDISFITVGTPGKEDGSLDISQIYEVSKEMANCIKIKNDFHIVVIRSTTVPGTNEAVTKIIEEISGKAHDADFAVVTNPEFLREGNAVYDFYNPEIILVGTSSDIAKKKLKDLYSDINAEYVATNVDVVEIMKYVNNSYHALKVCFANEIGNICKSLNIDGNKVMEIFCKDNKLNLSSYYFKPGFAYGGSCLPKDLEALRTLSISNGINSPILNSICSSNRQHIEYGIKLIKSFNYKNIGILGITFKSNTNDLRFSPILEVIKTLQNEAYSICVYDKILRKEDDFKNVNTLLNNNKNIITFKDTTNELINASDVVVITNKEKEYDIICNQYPEKIFIDLCGQFVDYDYTNVYSLSK